MPMVTMQTVIARMCVDIRFRQSLLNNPDGILQEFDLTTQEREHIKALDMEAVQEYALSLVGKKIGLLRKWFPLIFSLLEQYLSANRIHEILQAYGLDNIRDNDDIGGDWVRSESSRFCDYCRDLLSRGAIIIPNFAYVLDFEAVKFSMGLDSDASMSAIAFLERNNASDLTFDERCRRDGKVLLGKHTRIHQFDYDISVLVTAIETKQPFPPLEMEPTWILFFKRPHALRVDSSTISPPLKDLLEMCDGTMTADNIISSIAYKYATSSTITEEELKTDCLTILEQLYMASVLTFDGEAI